MGWRKVVAEYEADLFPVPKSERSGGKRGKLERKTYGDGEERLKIRLRKVDVEDGATVRVVIDGDAVCDIKVADGKGRAELSSGEGTQVPSVRVGSVVEIQHQGQPFLRGTFEPD